MRCSPPRTKTSSRDCSQPALRVRGASYDMSGEPECAEAQYGQAVAIFEALGDEDEAEHLRHRIAVSARSLGDLERASRLASEALERDRRRGNRRDEAIALHTLAMVAFAQGDPEEGLAPRAESAPPSQRAPGSPGGAESSLISAADWLIDGGDPLKEPFASTSRDSQRCSASRTASTCRTGSRSVRGSPRSKTTRSVPELSGGRWRQSRSASRSRRPNRRSSSTGRTSSGWPAPTSNAVALAAARSRSRTPSTMPSRRGCDGQEVRVRPRSWPDESKPPQRAAAGPSSALAPVVHAAAQVDDDRPPRLAARSSPPTTSAVRLSFLEPL